MLVNLREPRDTVTQVVKDRAYTVPVLLDIEGDAARAYTVRGTPTVFLVGRDGALLGAVVGSHPWTAPENRALLRALLGAD